MAAAKKKTKGDGGSCIAATPTMHGTGAKKGAAKKDAKGGARGLGDDAQRAVVIAAMKRAVGALERGLEKGARLEPGTHSVGLRIDIEGDLIVAEDVPPGEPREVPTVGAAEALIGAVALYADDGTLDEFVAEWIGVYAKLNRSEKGRGEIAALRARLDPAMAESARKRGLVEVRSAPGRSGAVTGRPGVVAVGRIGSRVIGAEVAAA